MSMKLLGRPIVVAPTGCWLWQGHVNRYGYGTVSVDGKKRAAHREVYALAKGPIPDGLVVDHLCRVRSCVNPEHVELVTAEENTARGRLHRLAQTHCARGHDYREHGYQRSDGYRGCRECVNENQRRRKRRQ